MEYLMTYGWAVLVFAIVVGILYATGVFGGGANLSSECAAEPGFTCSNPTYTPNGITVSISDASGQNYYDSWIFVVSRAEDIGSSGLPVNFSETSTANMVSVGTLIPSHVVTVNFNYEGAGAIPAGNIPVGTPFIGYVWVAYCTAPVCPNPTNFVRIGSITAIRT
jgi:hypothetical protein